MSLQEYGWTAEQSQHLTENDNLSGAAARVIAEHRGEYRVITASGELDVALTGRLRHAGRFPAVGDWVLLPPTPGGGEKATISEILPRRTQISRKVTGKRTAEQVLAANVDLIFLVMGLDGDFNVRRIERFLTMTWDSGASPVVFLNKADLVTDLPHKIAEVEAVCLGTPVHGLSCATGEGLEGVSAYLEPRTTICFLGSSGAGKSTLINRLLGRDHLLTEPVRPGDDRGRHTTTHRQLIRLPQGALLIDSPGIREIQLWGQGDGLSQTFEDLENLARGCRFGDCSHQDEPGCAVLQAVAAGDLDPARLAAFSKLQREARYFETRHQEHLRRAEGRRFGKMCRSFYDHKKRVREE